MSAFPSLLLKASEQLHKARSQVEEIEARAKGKMAQAEMDAINNHRTKCARPADDSVPSQRGRAVLGRRGS